MKDDLKKILSALGRWIANQFKFNDIVFLLAAVSLGYGIFQIYQPGAFIVMGSLFLILTVYGRFK